jgi:hypothetical protein
VLIGFAIVAESFLLVFDQSPVVIRDALSGDCKIVSIGSNR